MPKLSIITINLNNLDGLQKTMQSVFEQTFTEYEYIIIDGGSTDGSKECIEQHSEKLAHWASEKDRGMYDAMNKGIRAAKGKYLMFLNSGDYLSEENVLRHAFRFIANNEPAQIYYGNMEIQRGNENVSIAHPPVLTMEYLARSTINHQAAFIERSVFCQFGLYDLNYKYASDHAFFLKALVNGVTFKHIAYDMVYYDMDGTSTRNWQEYAREMEIAREKEIPAEFNKMKEELLSYKKLMSHRIIKYAVRLNKFYQGFRSRMK